ncbi:uncharacterized protein BDZ99DRAFT_464667 [Mytilinidion resinicola]|uniref:Heterokaryon incompatibility domain-containing protein n=1 Tax=Mytilinidion resinicola TaxID=574789 RepID=A0A6A6YIK2_9PEZI|nr:uncharacterized protein BDZ99DRAFT_464667 [Mytilinidion resinicola]KAF2807757.1 hypothetical protein BDZ99DRAFT_464667 [Mytilinidion resinicola]
MSKLHTRSPVTNSLEDSGVVRAWLKSCTDHHELCRKTISGILVRDGLPGNALPTRIIEVGDDRGTPPKLVATEGQMGIYLALSYCWGTTQQSSQDDEIEHLRF